MSVPAQIVIAALLIVGGVFGVVGSWGLVRFPDPMTRLHGPTKAATLGVGAVLGASMAAMYCRDGVVSLHELLVALFLFITSPLTGLFIAKAHLNLSWRADELPSPVPEGAAGGASETRWATFSDSAVASPMTDAAEAPQLRE